ncbi:hypothetical protein GGI11_001799 [Coemansia sp. RSA 2049]|nr:hypothetical protein GGI11_001799 [Coemansia sp. RSA 2049]
MHVTALPDVVLARVFHFVCNGVENPHDYCDHYTLRKWRGCKLPLLAVCRAWRGLAFASVHRASFFSCTSTWKQNKKGVVTRPSVPSNGRSRNRANAETYVTRSNLDIVASSDSSSTTTASKPAPNPRNIQLYVKSLTSPARALQLLVDKIRSHSVLLHNASTLELVFGVPNVRGGSFGRLADTDAAADMDAACLAGKAVAQLVPSIKYVEWFDYNSAPVVLEFAKWLIKGYAHQLVGFTYPQTALGEVNSFSNALTYVDANDSGPDLCYMPNICAENLTVLRLLNVDINFDWGVFRPTSSHNDNGSLCLYFNNLKSMSLKATKYFNDYYHNGDSHDAYSEDPATRRFPYKIIAPKLSTLKAVLCPNAYMNHLLGIEDLAGYSKARVLCYDSAIDYNAIAWNSIMDLKIHGTVGLADLLVLVHRAPPCLQNIDVSELSFDSHSENASQVMDKNASVHPIASNLCLLKYELVQIYIQSPLNPVFSLQGIVEKLGMHSGLLGNVRKLELFVDFIQTESSWTRHPASMASACKIGSVFPKLVPSVRYIEWQADTGAPVFSVFAKHLVCGYAGQLTGFLCPQMALEETQEFSSSLTQIALGLALRMHRALWLPSFVIVIALGFWETVYCVLHRMVSSEADADSKINTYIRKHRQQHEERQENQETPQKAEEGEAKTAAITRVAIVTGANGGIGMETARALGLAGFTTILACRNSKRGQNALSALENSTGLRDSSAFRLMELDLASFASIERFASEVERLYGRVHVLVCNAGTAFSHYDTTYDGLEAQFGTNFVGHYVLANRLEPALRRAGRARITVAASVAACMVHEIDYTRVTDVWRFGRFANYATSKLALLVFARALARRLDGSGVTVNAFHPGIVATSLYRNVLFTMLPGVDGFLRRWLWLDQRAGAVTSVYLALSPELDGKSGGYYARELPAATHPDALDVAAQDRLCCFTDVLIATNTHAPTLLQSINAAATSSSSSSSV